MIKAQNGARSQRQKSNRFNSQNNNFARASRFFVHFFADAARLRRAEMPNFTFYRGSTQAAKFLLSFSTWIWFLGIQL